MNNRTQGLLKIVLTSLDFLAINLFFFVAEAIFRHHGLISQNREYSYFILSINLLWLGSVTIKNVYDDEQTSSFERFSKTTLQAYLLFLMLMVGYLFFFRMLLLSRVFISGILLGIAVMLMLNRFLYLVIYRHFKRSGEFASRIVIIGYNPMSKKLVDYLTEDGMSKQVIGFCEEAENINELSMYPILSGVSDAVSVCKTYGANEIYSTLAPEHHPDIYRLIQSADQNCIRFRIVPDLGVFFKRQMHVDYFREIPVINLRREPLEAPGNRFKKRIFDLVISSLVMVLILSWLIPLIGFLILLESKGNIFFRQLRTGKNNRNFSCLKFRSMYMNTDADTKQATRDDARVTKVGRFLRNTSLDEFPQFINVFLGDMSIIGPRPHMLKHTDEYSNQIGQYMVRQFMKPGISGWAQINGLRGETKTIEEMHERVEYDIWYMENWSLFLDLKILIITTFNIVRGDNAF